jgi:hypothetical protein
MLQTYKQLKKCFCHEKLTGWNRCPKLLDNCCCINTRRKRNIFVHSFVIQPITKKKHVCTFICNSTNHQKETCVYIHFFFLVIGWITNECTHMFLFGDWLNYKWMYKHVSFWWPITKKKHVCTFICSSTNHQKETCLYIHL